MTSTVYTVRLTPGERKALDIADADGWRAYWLQYDGESDLVDVCHEQDCTPEYVREQVEAAKATIIADDALTLVANSDLETDITDHLEMAIEGIHDLTPAHVRAINSLLRKIERAQR